ncbi:hypothetical protein SARC_14025 [Sphaeroforma arctica JP610]|uniref:Uncharacterized protein n=1 Tax=Sphaeroforma arctica JP610 TaxID=667725 RepID=A0A0L0FBE5_9EUKA|nr:hypothetical protein SARC_14025 [Sphaeroforma arctica JP610]KNC73418.1 hypothetical protein SARC_14025 [Sphaeroforma arctica JP610]|eukprot:XP_014147320.1 hypothetical protein SARC_14025 [Sphaeroforma arctica JP610]
MNYLWHINFQYSFANTHLHYASHPPKGSVDANNERDATISYIDGKQCHFAEVNEMIVRKLKQMAHQAPDFGDMPAPGYTMLSAAIARSLCFINKVKSHWKIGRDLAARVIVVNASPDYAAQYMSVMNCIFAAVKQKVVIDACSLNTHKGTTSGFLQQATEITGGLHMSIKMSEPLLQYLIV